MRQISIIASNAFMELVRQPIFLLLFTLSPLLCVGLALFDYFGFGGTSTGPVNFDIKMVKDGALTVTFFSGLAAAVLCATASISREMETGTALAVFSKPVGRLHFLLGKYLGIIGALSAGAYLNLIGVLLASRMASDAYANFDIVGTITFLIFIALAFLAGGLANYFLHKPFVPTTVGYLTIALTIGFFVICAQDKTTAYYYFDGLAGESGAGIKATFWEIWTFTDTGGKRGEEVLQKLDKDKNMWEYVDFGMIQLTLLILFALWILSAIAVACSTRLSWMPTMMICTGVFIIGMMSDYFLGESAEGGGLIRQGEYVEYRPPERQNGMHKAFLLEPQGIRRLNSLQYRVRVYFSNTQYEGEAFEDEVITYDAGTNRVATIDYDFLREQLNNEFKLQWNRPLNNAMITVGRELMPTGFPIESWETSVFLRSDEFQKRKQEKKVVWQAKADKEGWNFSERESELTQNLVETIRREKEQELVNRMILEMDANSEKFELGGFGLEDDDDGSLSEKMLAEREEQKEKQKGKFKVFQSLRAQSQMETLPGQLSFWIRPQAGTIHKWDNGKRVLREVSHGSVVSKILYVLLPNWQLFWLSDAVSPEEEELKVLIGDMKYREGHVPWKYVFTSLFYVVLYVCLVLSGALWLFEDRELN
ncbi:MAG: ABC transporter permease [Verrucomicrobiota bacterium]|jgi:hypothetical protein|nr:ABC transporter permease [Verrucomicrobiota bacterium]